MYANCIFCSADLGRNEAIEAFPVGRAVAFDSARGRLWAVCPSCGRWNLAPIEERWEPVEEAEKQFRDARMRAQSENVGLAQLADGTRLIRVGEALSGEMAAWRYGRQLLDRRRKYWVSGAGATAAMIAVYSGLSVVVGGGIFAWMGLSGVAGAIQNRQVIHRLPGLGANGEDAPIRRWHVKGMNLRATELGGIELHIRDIRAKHAWWVGIDVDKKSDNVAVVYDDVARSILARTMVHVNEKGATQSKLKHATEVLGRFRSADEMLLKSAQLGVALGDRAGEFPTLFQGADALAFEMALNEENERRALEGELAQLELAWREAEEIAAIADRLPFDLDLGWLRGR